MIDSCIGADPGPATGLMFMDYEDARLVGWSAITVPGQCAVVTLKAHILAYYAGNHVAKRVGSIEHFVTGQSAGSRGKAADVTRQLEMEIAEILQMFGYKTTIRPAADVKPWATDKRLVAAGIPLSVVGRTEFRHAMDGGRHCIYGAREAGVIPDPLASVTRSQA